MHIKRRTILKFWPIARSGSKYIMVPAHEKHKAVPLMVFMRDILEIVRNKKELKRMLLEKKIMINGKLVKEASYPLMFYDSLSIPVANKHYRVWMIGRRFNLIEIKEAEAENRVYKVINTRKIKEGKIQVNLDCGRNIISSEKIKPGDFVLFNNSKNKIDKILYLKENVEVIAIAGKHAGKTGKVKEIVQVGEETLAVIKTKMEEIKANINNLYVIA